MFGTRETKFKRGTKDARNQYDVSETSGIFKCLVHAFVLFNLRFITILVINSITTHS